MSNALNILGVSPHFQYIKQGDEVLINGAGGGMGSFALQIAKSKGAVITAVDREDKFDLMRSLGADRVLDYTKTNYTQENSKYDFILDMEADKKSASYKSALKQGGTFVMVGGKMSTILAVHMASSKAKKSEDKHMSLLMWKANEKDDIKAILDMAELGIIKPAIDKVYRFEDAVKAIEYCWNGNAKGKVVLTMEE